MARRILILIVEDEAALAEMYAMDFSKAGFAVDIAHSGSEGFDKMMHNHPDIVLMDIVMADPNGVATLEKARQEPSIKNIPVVMLTNFSGSIELQNAMQMGAADYIIKSDFTPAQVVEKVKKILNPLPK
jgi:DNA-binding response OmpR family regulator